MSAVMILGAVVFLLVVFILSIFIMRSMEDPEDIFPETDDNDSYDEWKKTSFFWRSLW